MNPTTTTWPQRILGLCVLMILGCSAQDETVQPPYNPPPPADTFAPPDTMPPVPDTLPPVPDTAAPDTAPPVPDTAAPDTTTTFSCANQADGTLCDDGNPATLNDACLGGTCQGQLSQAGWHYQFNPGISGRFSRIRIQQFGGVNWSPWVAVAEEWQSTYMGSTFPGSYPDYSVEIENDCLNPADAESFTNAALSDWFTTSGNALSKPGFMVLRRADGSKEVVLSTIEASIQSYSPPFGSCQTQEAIAMKGLKMKVVDCVNDTHCVDGKTCNSLSMCTSN